MRFDYFYDYETEQSSFVKIPKTLLTEDIFSGLSFESKMLYGILRDRMSLSAKKKWIDEQKRLFIIYQVKDIQRDLGLSHKKAIDYISELERIGLLEKKRRGLGMPNILYIKHYIDENSNKPNPPKKESRIEKSVNSIETSTTTTEEYQTENLVNPTETSTTTKEETQSENLSNSTETSTITKEETQTENHSNPTETNNPTTEENQTETHLEENLIIEETATTKQAHTSEHIPHTIPENTKEITLREHTTNTFTHYQSFTPANTTSQYTYFRSIDFNDSRNVEINTSRNTESNTSRNANHNINISRTDNSRSDNSRLQEVLKSTFPDKRKPNIYDNDKINNNIYNNLSSYPILSQNQSISKIGCHNDEIQQYAELIKENIEYDSLKSQYPYNESLVEEIYDIILETVLAKGDTILVARNQYPIELVKSKFLKLDSMHIGYVIDCLQRTTTKIRNIKKYLLAALFNATSTFSNYYRSLVNHDIPQCAM